MTQGKMPYYMCKKDCYISESIFKITSKHQVMFGKAPTSSHI